jgi:protein associated with RNAse G/E
MERLGEDEHGTWLWSPKGSTIRRGDDPPKQSKSDWVKLITRDRWWTAIWNAEGRYEVFVDIATPAEWDGDAVAMIDLDLDVGRARDGSVTIEDEDEFAEHQVRYGYPADVIDRARTTTARLALDVAERREPFGAVGARWLEALPGA